MKRTDRLTILIAVVLFLAMAAYLGAYAVRSLETGVVTAEAISADFELSGVASGIVVREETVLTSGEAYIDLNYGEGEKVAAGSVLATAVSSEQGLERANRIHTLELEISRVEAALRGLDSADSVTSRETALTAAAQDLAAAVARHDVAVLDSASLNLSSLLLGVDSELVSQEHLDALERELQSLRTSTTADAVSIKAEKAGTWSSVVDGFEHLTLADLQDCSPSELREKIDESRQTVPDAFGKLVTGHRWYFVAAMSAVDAANLRVNRNTSLNFGRYYGADVTARVLSVSPSEDGQVTVVFRCDSALADTMGMRTVTANVIFDTYSGIRIPAQAVRADEEKETAYVWCVTAMQLERKNIQIIYAADDFVIAERQTTTRALRDGNVVVVSGKDLYEGKVVE